MSSSSQPDTHGVEPSGRPERTAWDFETVIRSSDQLGDKGLLAARQDHGLGPGAAATHRGDYVDVTAPKGTTGVQLAAVLREQVPAGARLVGELALTFTTFGSGSLLADDADPA